MKMKHAKSDFDTPTDARKEALETLNQLLTSLPILVLPRHDRPYIVDCAASAYQLGCTLLQEQMENTYHTVGRWSYTLNDRERNYSGPERECYAVVWAITTLLFYVEGTRFTVRTENDFLL